MSVLNHTPFPAIAFRQFNLAGDMMGVVSMRGTFKLVDEGPLAMASKQEPLELSDVYGTDDPHASDMITQGSLVPFKPGTDVTFVGAAYTLDGAPAKTWTCGVSVGQVFKNLRVHGPRHWIDARSASQSSKIVSKNPSKRHWVMGEAEPVPYVVLSWDHAFGGIIPDFGDGLSATYQENPRGRGIVNNAVPDDVRGVPAPQIEAIDKPISNWTENYEPENIAPIPPFWPQRQRLAGTYDDDWLNNRHPLLPKNFDFRFWQCAHPDLIAKRWLRGDEEFELRNLLYRHPRVRGTLPGINLQMQLPQGDATGVAPLVLDGVHFDMRPGVGRVFLTWRAGFPWPDGQGLPVIIARDPLPEAV
jgi:hypothetical protein